MGKVNIKFIKDAVLGKGEIQVEIRARQRNQSVAKLINYLNGFDKKKRDLLPVKTSDRIVTIKYDELVKIEVQATNLTFYTTDEVVKTTGRLYQVLDRLNNDFIQVSRHAAININYLESIEEGFAGSMVAILTNNLKADVSRRYLPSLERELGL
jgi:DNA-binding LytR/AlgR family response regulator